MYLLYFQRDRVVVEGSNGVSLTCSSVGHQGEVSFDKVKRTPLSTLNERLEVDIKKPTEISGLFGKQKIICTATDKNGETRLEHFICSCLFLT